MSYPTRSCFQRGFSENCDKASLQVYQGPGRREIRQTRKVDQLFWYVEGTASIVLNDKVRIGFFFGFFFEGKLSSLQTRLVDLPITHRYTKVDRIDRSRVFFKGQLEISSISTEFFVIHIVLYYFYTAYNSTVIYKVQGRNSQVKTWSATLGGAVAMA